MGPNLVLLALAGLGFALGWRLTPGPSDRADVEGLARLLQLAIAAAVLIVLALLMIPFFMTLGAIECTPKAEQAGACLLGVTKRGLFAGAAFACLIGGGFAYVLRNGILDFPDARVEARAGPADDESKVAKRAGDPHAAEARDEDEVPPTLPSVSLATQIAPRIPPAHISHLTRAEFAHRVADSLHTDVWNFQMHLWARFRDMMKVYFGMLGILGIAARELIQKWETFSMAAVSGAVFISIAFILAVVCAWRLYDVFRGEKYSSISATHIEETLWEQAAHFSDNDDKSIKTENELYPPLSRTEHLRGGKTPEAGLALAVDRIAQTKLMGVAKDVFLNDIRSKKLACARHLLGITAVFAVLSWIAISFLNAG